MAEEVSYDCVLLDVMIPGEDGFSICEKLRKRVDADAPIIFLSCLTEADRQIEGFAAGGIDYITKDTPEELWRHRDVPSCVLVPFFWICQSIRR